MKHALFLQTLAEACLQEIPVEHQSSLLTQLEAVSEVWATAPTVRDMLDGGIPLRRQIEILQRWLGNRVDGTTRHVFSLLLKEGAMSSIPALCDNIRSLRERRGLGKEVTVVTVGSLSTGERERLQAMLAKKFQMPVTLMETLDPTIIGGLRLQSEEWTWDATIAHRLERLTQHLQTT